MFKKGISLIVLIVSIVIILILSGIIITRAPDMTEEIEKISFERKINIIEKAIRIKNSAVKLNDSDLIGDLVNETIYNQYSSIISEIETKYNVNIYTSNQYYYIDTEDLIQLNTKNIEGEYFVNYEEGIVFSLNPLITEDESVYTTQDI